MKKFLLLFTLLTATAVSFTSCDNDDDAQLIDNSIEATILGRWVSVGFDNNIRYDFTADKRYTIYSTDSTFATLEEVLADNPDLPGNDWFYSGDTLVVDLNFGNFSKRIPTFVCDNYVINWTDETGQTAGTYYREEHDISTCD